MRHFSRLQAAWLSVVVLATAQWTDAYSTGAPDSACSTMTPNHAANAPQTSQTPYQLTPDGVSVDGGAKITVTLSTVSPTGSLKGFLLQARDTNTDLPLGTFVTDKYGLVSCNDGLNNAITHSDGKSTKPSVVVEWTAPADYEGEVAFRATVVENYARFWTGLTSEKVTVKRSAESSPTTSEPSTAVTTPASTDGVGTTTRRRGLLSNFRGRTTQAPKRTTTEATTTTKRNLLHDDGGLASAINNIYFGCNVNKGCFGMPVGCDRDCDALMTYTKFGSEYQFEIMGKVNAGSSSYVAGGLSTDETMGGDSVMACRSVDGQVDITMAMNSGKSNNFLADPKLGISKYEMTQVDGIIYCRFNRQARIEIDKQVFDLDNAKFYIMVANGPLSSTDGSLTYHTGGRLVSSKDTSMSAFEVLGASSDLYVVLHASFMVSAWVGAASSGIVMARYFKQTWKNAKIFNIDQWFHFHRMFMGTTWALTVAGFILIVVQLNGWTSVPASVNPHAYIGIVSIGLCFIQPFMAMCRCAPSNPRRAVFNWFHWFVGNAAQTLGITAIFFGLDLYQMPRWTWWIMIVFVGFHCITHILFSIGECVSDSKAKNQVSGIPMKDMNSSRDMLQPPQDKVLDAPGGGFRKALLALYLLVIWLVVAMLLLVIVVGEDQLKEWNVIFWE